MTSSTSTSSNLSTPIPSLDAQNLLRPLSRSPEKKSSKLRASLTLGSSANSSSTVSSGKDTMPKAIQPLGNPPHTSNTQKKPSPPSTRHLRILPHHPNLLNDVDRPPHISVPLHQLCYGLFTYDYLV